uniref:Crp/Fnr family transcriptional regulator n=1 Tax=Marinobacterium profundum TaxID=1714300 RepID=UPI0008367284|nr:Crp/Fnr family transcriptional regulator [Marinobacterium profundum]
MPCLYDPLKNHLLAALPTDVYARLSPYLESIPLPLGQVLCESGCELRHAYFPTDSIISMLYVMLDGASAEVAVVGNEGIIGIALFMGGETMPNRAVVQSAGHAYRLPGQMLKQAFHDSIALQHLLLRYTQALLTQVAQTAVCNRHHSLDQQLCRSLLLSHDRLPSDEMLMTQELIANMLGVRREGVTEAAGKLQAAGLIHYQRGHISILDRAGLEARACECYAVVKREYDRLLPAVGAQRSTLRSPAPGPSALN